MLQVAVPKCVSMQAQSCQGRTLGVQFKIWNFNEQLVLRRARPSRGHVTLDLLKNHAELPGSAPIATKLPLPKFLIGMGTCTRALLECFSSTPYAHVVTIQSAEIFPPL
jgi:hypothetical protein